MELSIEHAARHFGVSRTTIRRWMHEGRLPWRRVGKQRLVNVENSVEVTSAEDPQTSAPDPGSQNETALVVLREHMQQIERDRDLAIRRIGQLEQAYEQLSFWRRGMLWTAAACLVLLALLVGGWMWAWKEVSLRGVDAVQARQELISARSDIERLAGGLNEAKSDLAAATESHASQRTAHQARIDSLEKDLAAERTERLRLAQDLATAIAEAAAKQMQTATQEAEAKAQIDLLTTRLSESQTRLRDLEEDLKSAPISPPSDVPDATAASAPSTDGSSQVVAVETLEPAPTTAPAAPITQP